MTLTDTDTERIRAAWLGRVSGCMLGKSIEVFTQLRGNEALERYLAKADAYPLRDYVPLDPSQDTTLFNTHCVRGQIERAEPDDDINYSVLALEMLELHGLDLSTDDVARTWLLRLPAAAVWTAEREAYRTLLDLVGYDLDFFRGGPADFGIEECSDNEFNDWIGAQIRVDVYGWILPGRPDLAAELARRDARLSHRGDGVESAAFVAALAACVPQSRSARDAVREALGHIDPASGAFQAVEVAVALVGDPDAVGRLREKFRDLSPVGSINNLALVVWGFLTHADDFSAAIGETVSAGWDTDCNGATVGGLVGLWLGEVPEKWTEPWAGRVAVSIAGVGELEIDALAARTASLASRFPTRE